MALSYKSRRRWSLFILLVGLPVYIGVALYVVTWFDDHYGRLPILAELLVFVVLGFLWMLPLRRVFLGVGRADPDAQKQTGGSENPPA